MPDDWKRLTLSDIFRLITALAQNGINFEAVGAIIAQVPAVSIPHGRITIESVERLLNQTNGSTYIPEELALLINQPEEQPLAIQPVQLTIDCNTQPKVPDMWQLGKHNMILGRWAWNLRKVTLTDLGAFECECTDYEFVELRCMDYGAVPANANVLDFLLEHPDLIPSEWKGKQIHFCGTVYEGGGDRMVRCLAWHSFNGWHESHHRDDYDEWEDEDTDDEKDDGEFVALLFP